MENLWWVQVGLWLYYTRLDHYLVFTLDLVITWYLRISPEAYLKFSLRCVNGQFSLFSVNVQEDLQDHRGHEGRQELKWPKHN